MFYGQADYLSMNANVAWLTLGMSPHHNNLITGMAPVLLSLLSLGWNYLEGWIIWRLFGQFCKLELAQHAKGPSVRILYQTTPAAASLDLLETPPIHDIYPCLHPCLLLSICTVKSTAVAISKTVLGVVENIQKFNFCTARSAGPDSMSLLCLCVCVCKIISRPLIG